MRSTARLKGEAKYVCRAECAVLRTLPQRSALARLCGLNAPAEWGYFDYGVRAHGVIVFDQGIER